MNLYKIQHELIANRTEDGWYLIPIAGPSFHYRWDYGWSSGSDGYSTIMGEHLSHAVCREEPSLTMSWGMDVHSRDERRELQFPWAEANFPDKSVHPIWVDFFWNNALIDRVELYRVDGARGVIPAPGYGDTVSHFELAVAWLVHSLEDCQAQYEPNKLLAHIGVSVEYDRQRTGAGSD